MGIPRYFRYITNANDGLTEDWSSSFEGLDVLYLDLNSLIHPIVRDILWTNEPDFRRTAYERVLGEIERLWRMTETKRVWVAIDGVAPRAKMEQQRRRRYKAAMERRQCAEIARKYGVVQTRWDTNAISPGTDFMRGLDQYLANALKKYGDACSFHGSGEAGEGEHKIMAHLRATPGQRVLIYGLDADLIMLSSLLPTTEVYLLREAIAFGRPVRDKYVLFRIADFRKAVCADILKRYGEMRIEKEGADDEFMPEESRIMVDYVFLCFLFGNDFIPHSYWLSLDEDGMALLLGHYSAILAGTSHYMVDIQDGKVVDINYRFLGRIINSVYLCEQQLTEAKLAKWRDPSKIRFRNAAGTLEGDIERQVTYLSASEKPIWNARRYLWTHFRVYEEYRNGEMLRMICDDYVRMLVWTIKYYVEGVPNWREVYRWTGSPLLKHMVQYFSKRIYMHTFKEDAPMTSAEQLALIMPMASKELIPEHYRSRVIESGYCMERYELDTFGHTMQYECEPIMPCLELCMPDGI